VLAALNGNEAARHQIDVWSTKLGWGVQAIQPHSLGLCYQAIIVLWRQFVGIRIEVLLQGHDLLADELADHLNNHFLFFGQGNIHGTSSRAHAGTTTQPRWRRPRCLSSTSTLPTGRPP